MPFARAHPQKGGDLRLNVLRPVLSEDGDYLIMTVLPFGTLRLKRSPCGPPACSLTASADALLSLPAAAEDVRTYEFMPLPSEERYEPSAEACAAAERLVESMTFGAAGASTEFNGDSRTLHNPTLRCAAASYCCCEQPRSMR